jgi:hypothetical protein
MYHLLKARNNSLSELKSPITGDQTVLLVGNQQTLIRSHNYFTKAIILNNRIKKRRDNSFTSIILPLELNYKLAEQLKQLELFLFQL